MRIIASILLFFLEGCKPLCVTAHNSYLSVFLILQRRMNRETLISKHSRRHGPRHNLHGVVMQTFHGRC